MARRPSIQKALEQANAASTMFEAAAAKLEDSNAILAEVRSERIDEVGRLQQRLAEVWDDVDLVDVEVGKNTVLAAKLREFTR